MSTIIRNIKGTKDVLLNETLIWQFIESKIHSFLKKYGFHEIKTPAFENTNLFIRSIGEQTDIVAKEMYSWTDQGGNHLTLKPEVTASVARAYIQHSLGKKNPLNKLYYIDSLFKDFILGDYDRASYEDTPEGTGFELVKTKALVKSHKEGSDKHRSELVTSYIFENQDKFNLLNMKLPEHLRRPEVRLTVDYAEDLIFCQQVYRALNEDGKLINVEDIIKFWDANPELRKPMEIIGIDWGHGRLWE